MRPVGFGVLGAGSFVAEAAVLPAILSSPNTFLGAACSLGSPLDPRWSDAFVDSYEAVLAHPDVDAVYVPLPNHLHLEWIEKCAEAGKHVLCEKPLALTTADARRAAEVCRNAGVMCAEAWMTPFHKRWRSMLLHASSGELGRIQSTHATFHFDLEQGKGTNFRLNPLMGGGAFNDVGIYCLGQAVHLWGAEPDTVDVTNLNVVDSVDRTTVFRLGWADGRHAIGSCSFEQQERQTAEITCEGGWINASHTVHTGGKHNSVFTWTRRPEFEGDGEWDGGVDTSRHVVKVPNNDPYETMVDRFALAIGGEREWPRPMDDVIAMTELMDRIREQI